MHNWNDINGDFHPESAMDFLPREQLRRIQSQRLSEIVKLAYERVPLHRGRMDELGVKPSDIKSIDDISKLPFTQKSDLRDTYPYGMFAADPRDIVRLHASSGTTGKPIVVAYTREDMEAWSSSVLRCLAMFGVRRGDFMQVCFGYGLFTGGLGLHGGAERMGCTVIPASGGNTERQLMIMRDFGATAIACTPSYFIHLVEEGETNTAWISKSSRSKSAYSGRSRGRNTCGSSCKSTRTYARSTSTGCRKSPVPG